MQRTDNLGEPIQPTKLGDVFTPEARTAIKRFTTQTVIRGLHKLREDYATLRAYKPPDVTHEISDRNLNKCRYRDVRCWDQTRIVLRWPEGNTDDFIHANRISNEMFGLQSFIATQGPLDATVSDFWRLVWQENIRELVMLCRCEEMGKNKCAQYWPMILGQNMTIFDGFIVTCENIDSTTDKDFIHTRLKITCERGVKMTRIIEHRQWITWPDKSVPQSSMAPFRVLYCIRKSGQPVLVHCSAGCGRTGTLMTIEIIYRSLIAGKMPNLLEIVRDLRAQRHLCVQTEDQYVYIPYALLQLFYFRQVAEGHSVRHFFTEYGAYLKMVAKVKVLQLNATSAPPYCAQCAKLAASIDDPGGPAECASEDLLDTSMKKKTSELAIRRKGSNDLSSKSCMTARQKKSSASVVEKKRDKRESTRDFRSRFFSVSNLLGKGKYATQPNNEQTSSSSKKSKKRLRRTRTMDTMDESVEASTKKSVVQKLDESRRGGKSTMSESKRAGQKDESEEPAVVLPRMKLSESRRGCCKTARNLDTECSSRRAKKHSKEGKKGSESEKKSRLRKKMSKDNLNKIKLLKASTPPINPASSMTAISNTPRTPRKPRKKGTKKNTTTSTDDDDDSCDCEKNNEKRCSAESKHGTEFQKKQEVKEPPKPAF